MSCCMLGPWMGGWVGGWVTYLHPASFIGGHQAFFLPIENIVPEGLSITQPVQQPWELGAGDAHFPPVFLEEVNQAQ